MVLKYLYHNWKFFLNILVLLDKQFEIIFESPSQNLVWFPARYFTPRSAMFWEHYQATYHFNLLQSILLYSFVPHTFFNSYHYIPGPSEKNWVSLLLNVCQRCGFTPNVASIFGHKITNQSITVTSFLHTYMIWFFIGKSNSLLVMNRPRCTYLYLRHYTILQMLIFILLLLINMTC